MIAVKGTVGKNGTSILGAVNRSLLIALYDLVLFLVIEFLYFGYALSYEGWMRPADVLVHMILFTGSVYLCRIVPGVYVQVWRYGGTSAYIRMIAADFAAWILYFVLQYLLPVRHIGIAMSAAVSSTVLLASVCIRLLYHFFYERAKRAFRRTHPGWRLFAFLTGCDLTSDSGQSGEKRSGIKIAIVGAGRVGVSLAEELLNNPRSVYVPCCFIDIDQSKIGREIEGIPVMSSEEATVARLEEYPIQEIVFALPQIGAERKRALYEHYKKTGCKIKVYDFPLIGIEESGRRHVREFDIEELLFRKPVDIRDEKTDAYYEGKTVLITGGGGSIGSELCRQTAKMKPKRLIILDICENGAYDIQQELRIAYGEEPDVRVEILSICDRAALEKVMERYRPDILLHAAAHKHVPLMEHNVCEAVRNNVFGTLNVVELAEKYGVGRFIMISSDKAVNPTNVMGATKRMCEMIVRSRSAAGSPTVFSSTRFGNVLGSAGSVIPLFRRQIMSGGPVTVTDKRIIRYFMTIPEASQLVLQSGYMAKNGELFVLDMGEPVKILDLAENMIRLSGMEPYRDIPIIETGLRPGEKLYEELLMQSETLEKTENSKIFIENDTPLSPEEIGRRLDILRAAVETEDDAAAREALRSVVETYCTPDELNGKFQKTE